ncbi:class I SAM-dependent methyltransferase [Antarcticibacterium sp. 1MA-6-2]|uniref:class I SAM-dependent methyltransferase n=1 Tax=Antarcticibacterium sp. 1MA-6-2 TaxID=2908210 RepID=UPI001F3903C1|nr:class I SAM-dependent methyltransferase [Antarcticibacterium sp. 1MA-6-2]UJH92495.1 class I SAM-dependent methyltransferase [Antarcticibacterium sp. 1MA-6-2]
MKKDEEDIIEINKRQQIFYDTKEKNWATKIWYSLRNRNLQKIRKSLNLEKQIQELHLEWCGDLSNKKVLDLGCYEGNSLSIYLAHNSKEYLAIDLSEKGINHLSGRIKNIENAQAVVVDFLSEDFQEGSFDLIYAYGVLHHFKNTNQLIARLKEKLNENGTIISNDPLMTSFPVKVARGIYRPFQSDKDWEWPFTRKTYYKFAAAFEIKDRRGMLGRVKKLMLLNLLPFSEQKKTMIAEKWHNKDWENSRHSDIELFRCMHITMLMQKKN